MAKRVLFLLAALAVIIGVIWIGQGAGVLPYPASSFMIDQMPWVYRGAALAVAGLIAIVLLRRK
jgi:hypothetical protein